MPLYNDDNRSAQEIRSANGESASVPGLTRGEDVTPESDRDSSEDFIAAGLMSEDWDDDTDEAPEIDDQETFNSRLETWAQDWTQQQQQANDPNAEALSIVDGRIQNQLAELQQAQEWAAQGQADRQDRAEIRAMQEEMNAYDEGSATLDRISQETAQEHGLPPSNPDAVMGLADQLFNEEALAFLNRGNPPRDWEDVKQKYAERCVEEATIVLGRQQIGDTALQGFASSKQWDMVRKGRGY
jgi:hypothetical protein